MQKKFMPHKMKMFILILFILSMFSYISSFILLFSSGYDISTFTTKMRAIKLSDIKFYIDKNSFSTPFYNSTITNDYDIDENVDSISFNLSSQNLEVNSYNGDTIQIKITGPKFSNNAELQKSQSDNKLVFSSSNTMNSNLNISVYIPESFIKNCNLSVDTSKGDIATYNLSADSVNISSYNGDIYLSNTNVNYLTLKNSNGDISINNIFCHIESKFNLGYGDLSGSGHLGLLDANNINGNISLDINSISKDISVSNISGDTMLLLPHDADYRANYNSLSGSLKSSSSTLKNGNELYNINITTTSGDTFIGLK